jgi:hypothetical protein
MKYLAKLNQLQPLFSVVLYSRMIFGEYERTEQKRVVACYNMACYSNICAQVPPQSILVCPVYRQRLNRLPSDYVAKFSCLS